MLDRLDWLELLRMATSGTATSGATPSSASAMRQLERACLELGDAQNSSPLGLLGSALEPLTQQPIPPKANTQGNSASALQLLSALAKLLIGDDRLLLEQGARNGTGVVPSAERVLLVYELSQALALFLNEKATIPTPASAAGTLRDLRRIVLRSLLLGSAELFVLLGRRLAQSAPKVLLDTAILPRLRLVMGLSDASSLPVDALALAILDSRPLTEHWIEQRVHGALGSRKLAGQLLDRAAREATFRASQGQLGAMQRLVQVAEPPRDLQLSDPRFDPLTPAYRALLNDREPLVWRHAAAVRGVTAAFSPRILAAVET
jgi:hypothetical protein